MGWCCLGSAPFGLALAGVPVRERLESVFYEKSPTRDSIWGFFSNTRGHQKNEKANFSSLGFLPILKLYPARGDFPMATTDDLG